jgi:hypothetical protein
VLPEPVVPVAIQQPAGALAEALLRELVDVLPPVGIDAPGGNVEAAPVPPDGGVGKEGKKGSVGKRFVGGGEKLRVSGGEKSGGR